MDQTSYQPLIGSLMYVLVYLHSTGYHVLSQQPSQVQPTPYRRALDWTGVKHLHGYLRGSRTADLGILHTKEKRVGSSEAMQTLIGVEIRIQEIHLWIYVFLRAGEAVSYNLNISFTYDQ